ncbi:MAG: hypothetical protein OEZ34_15275 [Spirochaetia bacterium]|nr:hypothetical protein [Spirochaetia bacterium]
MKQNTVQSFFDVEKYPDEFLQIHTNSITIPATYKNEWDDDFGARGWKLDIGIGNPDLIATNRQTGGLIPTSIFVHDILDHFVSGFGVTDHRSEAMALIQLYLRTGSDPRPDYEQMVKEDIIKGIVDGDMLSYFLPDNLLEILPAQITQKPDSQIIQFLIEQVGEAELFNQLMGQLYRLGNMGKKHARVSWKKCKLDYHKRKEIGLMIQDSLAIIDIEAESGGIDLLHAAIHISNSQCSFNAKTNNKQVL